MEMFSGVDYWRRNISVGFIFIPSHYNQLCGRLSICNVNIFLCLFVLCIVYFVQCVVKWVLCTILDVFIYCSLLNTLYTVCSVLHCILYYCNNSFSNLYNVLSVNSGALSIVLYTYLLYNKRQYTCTVLYCQF